MAQTAVTVQQVGGVSVFVSETHRFGTDAFLLAGFARARRSDLVCDLGSGCGIIPLLLLRGETAPVQVSALELAPDAVALMERAVEVNGLAGRFVPLEGDLRRPHPWLPAGGFHLVTCNPPYFVPGTGFQSPNPVRSAARQEDSCTLEEVCAAAARLLRYGGRFCLCHRPERLCDVLEAMRAARLEPKRLRFVQQREGGAPWLFLCEGRLGGRPALTVEPSLTVEHPDGGFSDEMLALYGKSRRLPKKEGGSLFPPEKAINIQQD